MKNQFKKLICVLAGHKMDYDCMEHHNAQVCLRCGDCRNFYYNEKDYWSDLEYFGLIKYPIWRIKNYILSKWVWVKLKTGKLKVVNKDQSDDCPF